MSNPGAYILFWWTLSWDYERERERERERYSNLFQQKDAKNEQRYA